MTTEIVYLCRYEGCRRAAAAPGQARCEEHRLRFVPGPLNQPPVPEWRRRALAHALPFKDFTGSAA